MAKVAVIGSGGREDTLVWKLRQSPEIEKIFAIPGSDSMGRIAECIDLPVKPPFSELIAFIEAERINLTVVGPEQPLVDGITDVFKSIGFPIFGPDKKAAALEGSKSFAKEVMESAGVPTAEARKFDNIDAAITALEESTFPIVIKADGLAAGKGVTVAPDKVTAEKALKEAMVEGVFGVSGNTVLLEECLFGEEATVMAITDGETILPLASSQDHKPVYDDDKGPNTGGMGAYSPAPIVTDEIMKQVYDEILCPTIKELKNRGIVYNGVLYAGLMITENGPKVIEFNCRFGDPETQVVLPRLDSDLYEIMQACIKGKLSNIQLDWDTQSTVCVVGASGGYPGSYEKGKLIKGLDEAEKQNGSVIFHAGTKKTDEGWVTNGGRVLGITAYGDTIADAQRKAYDVLSLISFDDMHYRKDIAKKALVK